MRLPTVLQGGTSRIREPGLGGCAVAQRDAVDLLSCGDDQSERLGKETVLVDETVEDRVTAEPDREPVQQEHLECRTFQPRHFPAVADHGPSTRDPREILQPLRLALQGET